MPKINAEKLRRACEALIQEAREARERQRFGSVNWVDICVADIERRTSLLNSEPSRIVVLIEEAAPDCELTRWMTKRIGDERVSVVAEW